MVSRGRIDWARADEEAACPFSDRSDPSAGRVAVARGPGLTNYKFPSELLLLSSIFVRVHVSTHADSYCDGRPDAQTPFSPIVHITIRAHGTGWTALAVADIFDQLIQPAHIARIESL